MYLKLLLGELAPLLLAEADFLVAVQSASSPLYCGQALAYKTEFYL
jgi:hypothetical protein